MDGSFRITGGVFINNNEIDLTGSPRGDGFWSNYSIPSEYSFAEPLKDTIKVNGTVEFNTFAPYVGIGWNSNVEKVKGWGVSFEMGVLFQGAPTVSSLTATAAPPLDAYANNPLVLQVLEQEKKAIEDDLLNDRLRVCRRPTRGKPATARTARPRRAPRASRGRSCRATSWPGGAAHGRAPACRGRCSRHAPGA